MKKIKGHLRCTTVEEVKERITSEALREYYEIRGKIEEEMKTGHVVSSILECEWVDKYCINPYRIYDNSISFLIGYCEIVYDFDEDYNILSVSVS